MEHQRQVTKCAEFTAIGREIESAAVDLSTNLFVFRSKYVVKC